MTLQAKLGHGDWVASKVGGIGGLEAIISKNFGYSELQVPGPLKVINPDHLEEHMYYKTLADLIVIEKFMRTSHSLTLRRLN